MNTNNAELVELESEFKPFLDLVPDIKHLKVHDIMSTEEIKVYENDTVNNAQEIMAWEDLKHVCVFNENNELVGTLHFSDVNKRKNEKKTVADIMHKNFHKIYGALNAEDGRKAVIKEKDHCLPVFEDKKIVGILNLEEVFQH